MIKTKYIIISALVTLASCSSEEPSNLEPVVRTLEASDISRTSATLQGSVTLSGSTSMPSLFFRYGETEAMTSSVPATVAADGVAAATISGLTPMTTYYYQLTATHHQVNIVGNMLTFATQPNDLPTVGQPVVLSQGSVSAIVGFDIPDDGGDPIIEAGCVVTENGQPATARTVQGELTTAEQHAWHVLVKNLQQNTTYTVVPYATTRMGRTDGQQLTLKTSDAVVVAETGDFARMFSGVQMESQSLSIVGRMNGDDLACLRQMGLKSIDMSDVTIVSGGGPYNGQYYSEDNVVGQKLFADCQNLESIILPQSITRIERSAFDGCTSLRELTIPAHVTSVEPSSGCTALTAIYVSEANTSFASVDGVLFNVGVTVVVWFPMGKTGSYTLPSTITAISDRAFAECSITTFTLPATLTTMGQGVFYNSKVEEVTLPDGLRSVPTGTFQRCSQLKIVHLGTATELMGGYVFYGCPLQHLHVAAATPPVCDSETFAEGGTAYLESCVLHVPAGKVRYYRNDSQWGGFAHIVEE